MFQLKSLIAAIIIFSAASLAHSQEEINYTDEKGLKQGRWIKKFENGNILYEGTFKDDKPLGEFKRYYISGKAISVLNHYHDSDSADASFFYPNGYLAAKGLYTGKNKSGVWRFYSEEKKEVLICEESYSNNLKLGKSTKFHLNGNKAEEINYMNDLKHGEWLQYYANAILCIKSAYKNGSLDGSFESFFANGSKEITGTYQEGVRTGNWNFYDENGSLRKTINYINGRPTNDNELIKQETEYLDMLEKNGGKIEDPAKTGIIW